MTDPFQEKDLSWGKVYGDLMASWRQACTDFRAAPAPTFSPPSSIRISLPIDSRAGRDAIAGLVWCLQADGRGPLSLSARRNNQGGLSLDLTYMRKDNQGERSSSIFRLSYPSFPLSHNVELEAQVVGGWTRGEYAALLAVFETTVEGYVTFDRRKTLREWLASPWPSDIRSSSLHTADQSNERLVEYLSAFTAANQRVVEPPLVTDRDNQSGAEGENQELEKCIVELENLGATVYMPPSRAGQEETPMPSSTFDWGDLRGYTSVKKRVEESLVSVFLQAAVYERVARATRNLRGGPAVPRAVLFYGPPGTGKTLCARVIAENCNVPLVYVPAEAFLSKFFGESEKNLAAIFRCTRKLGVRSLIFLDEIDSVLLSREDGGSGSGGGTQHTERRLLASFLRQLDGFESKSSKSSVTLIAATNRPNDIDAAMLSRFELQIPFDLPSEEDRVEIFREYAQHLDWQDLLQLARESAGLSGRNIRDDCIQAERRFVHRLVNDDGLNIDTALPTAQDYSSAIQGRTDSGNDQ
mmetsp:Transcript_2623/g.4037  ORF Transcript_2623/g.4037 Transcript_2623/m.4037 type:complete len:526 (+) Transcript_2623:1349-2926(+)